MKASLNPILVMWCSISHGTSLLTAETSERRTTAAGGGRQARLCRNCGGMAEPKEPTSPDKVLDVENLCLEHAVGSARLRSREIDKWIFAQPEHSSAHLIKFLLVPKCPSSSVTISNLMLGTKPQFNENNADQYIVCPLDHSRNPQHLTGITASRAPDIKSYGTNGVILDLPCTDRGNLAFRHQDSLRSAKWELGIRRATEFGMDNGTELVNYASTHSDQ
eukprot:6180523-Pleurochrysis_carterae.AAC.2